MGVYMEVPHKREYICFGCPVYGGFNQTFQLDSTPDQRKEAMDICQAVEGTIRSIIGRNPDMYLPDADENTPTHVQYVAGVGRNGCSQIRLRTIREDPETHAKMVIGTYK